MTSNINISIGLLRHGETEHGLRYRGSTDDHLTATGWQQMWAAVDGVFAWQVIISSPLSRCARFARALATRQSLPLQIDTRLRELDFGAWEDRTAAEIIEKWPQAFARFCDDPWSHRAPGGEPVAHMRARVLAAWHDVLALRRPALLVCHGGPIRLILAHVCGVPRAKLLQIAVPYGALRHVTVRLAGDTARRIPLR